MKVYCRSVSPVEEFASPVTQLGFGGMTDFLVGYAAKKVVKILLVVLGVYISSLLYLDHQGFISINYGRLHDGFQSLAEMGRGGTTIPGLLTANIPFTGSFVTGLGLGFKTG